LLLLLLLLLLSGVQIPAAALVAVRIDNIRVFQD